MNHETTTLEPSFLRAVVMMVGFKGTPMRTAQCALLHIGLRNHTFTAADLPGEVCNGSRHIAGAATGSLVALGILSVVGRVKSPHENAKGRKLDLLTIPPEQIGKAHAFLRANNCQSAEPVSHQLNLLEVG